jgi:hypothetical protein
VTLGLEVVPLARMWKESLRGTIRECVEKVSTAPMEIRSDVKCCRAKMHEPVDAG